MAFHRVAHVRCSCSGCSHLRCSCLTVLTLPASGQSRSEPSQSPRTARPPGGGTTSPQGKEFEHRRCGGGARSAGGGGYRDPLQRGDRGGGDPLAPNGAQARFARTPHLTVVELRSFAPSVLTLLPSGQSRFGTSSSPSAPQRSPSVFSCSLSLTQRNPLGFSNSCLAPSVLTLQF